MLTHGGYRIIASAYLVSNVQFRKPRSKGKRIREKWAKNVRNWRKEVDTRGIFDHSRGVIYMHPHVVEELKKGGYI